MLVSADKRVQPDLGDRVHQHAGRRDVTVDELRRRDRGAATEQQLVADRVQRPIQDRLATDEQRVPFVNAKWCGHGLLRRSVNRVDRPSQPTATCSATGTDPRVFADERSGMPEGSTNGKDPQWPS